MTSTRLNALDQALDIAGSLVQSSSMTLANEPLELGAALTGQTGSNSTITAVTGSVVTIGGLTGITASSVGNFITFTGAANANNNGTFLVISYNSATSVDISNSIGVFPDANTGSIAWTERCPYSLQDDLNYERTDRAAIKGVDYYVAVPTYQRPTAVGTNVPTNLSNIAGKTLDAHAWVINRKFVGVSVSESDDFATITSAGNLKHADAVNRIGVPISDGLDAGALEALYVEIIDPLTNSSLVAVGGITDGYKIFGLTRAGTTGVSPNSVEVEFRAVPYGSTIATSIAYAWDANQPSIVDFYYGFRERADQLTETAFRPMITGSGISINQHQALRQLIHFINEGPASGFATGAYKEILPLANPFPTDIIWYTDSSKTNKIVEKTIVYNSNKTPNTITWRMYSESNILLATVADTIAYTGIFETSRTRLIS